jgi:hypothetical protein
LGAGCNREQFSSLIYLSLLAYPASTFNSDGCLGGAFGIEIGFNRNTINDDIPNSGSK